MATPTKSVFLVPGFMGSELFTSPYAYGVIPNQKIWLNYAALAAGFWAPMELKSDGTSGVNPVVGNLVPAGPVDSYYGPLIRFFLGANYKVWVTGQDWRQETLEDAERVASAIREVGREVPVNIVCHSRGGLVTRRALYALEQSGDLGCVARVAGFGVPHQGTLEAIQALAVFSSPLDQIIKVLERNPLASITPYNAPRLARVVRSWPALYELLPNPSSTWLNPGDVNTIYEYSAWSSFQPPISEFWLSTAVQLWSQFPPVPVGVEWLDVIGTGFVTPQGLAEQAIPHDALGETFVTTGDGVVIYQSAHLGIGPSITSPTQHSYLCLDGRIPPHVDAWFQAQLAGDVVIPGPPLP